MAPSRNSPLSGASIRIRNRTWLQGTILVGLAGYAVATVLQAATSGLAALPRLTEPWGLVGFAVALVLMLRGRLAAGTVLALGVAWIEMATDFLFTPWGIRSAAAPTLPLVVLAAGMVAGPWGSRVVAGVTAVWVPLALLVGHHVLGRGPGIPVQDLITVAAFEIAVLGTAIGLELVLRTFGEVLQVARDSERRTTELLEASPDAIVGIAPEGDVEAFNREAARVFGCPRAAVLGRPASALAIRALDGGEPLSWDAVGGEGRPGEVLAAGTGLHLEVNARDVEREDGRRGRILTLRDVTERRAAEEHARRLEQHVRDAQKLESLGLLAGGIAHDFNNLLTVVGGYAALLAETGDPEVQGLSREVLAAQRRGALLTRQLLTFARRDVAQPEPLDLGALLLDVGKLVARVVGESVALDLDPRSPCPLIADAGRVEQVILNLAANARDAMPGGGTLYLGCRYDPAAAEVTLEVTDTGTGMDAATRERLFEPFFTTKPRGKGTGLGLATAHGIVTAAGGRIEVASEVGRGTTFRVVWPACEPGRVARVTDQVQRPTPPGEGRILLVEDDAHARAFVERMLARGGYSVTTAQSGTEAVALLAGHGGAIDLLLTDVAMPGMTGPDLAAWVARRMPRLPVLFMSGHLDDALGDPRFDPVEDLILKPFTADELLRRVAAKLQATAPPTA